MAMRKRSLALLLLAAPFAHAADAVNVTPVTVASGHFLAEDCAPESDPKTTNECVCKADIIKAQVNGLPKPVATTINNQLSQVPEQLASESCAGKPTTTPESGIAIGMTIAKYEVVYQSQNILSVLVTYATAGAGAAHPNPGSEGYTFNLQTGKTLDPAALLTPEQLAKANEFAHAELLKKHGDTMLEEARIHVEPYITDGSCENCTLYYAKDGWNLRFNVYAVAPYAAGEPTIVIPTSIIPDPETLIARKK
jgi:hypothetical protein